MKTDSYRAQRKKSETLEHVIITAMLISSRGQFGLNAARLEEGQRQQLLPEGEQGGPQLSHSSDLTACNGAKVVRPDMIPQGP